MTQGLAGGRVGCSHADVATVTAVSKGLEGSRLGKETWGRRREVHSNASSLPARWSHVIPNYRCSEGKGGGVLSGCRGPGGGGCTRNTERGKRGALWCTLEPSLHPGKHPRLSLRIHKGKVVAEISLICSFKRTCVRRVKISVGDNFPVKCKKSVCGLQIQLYIHSSPCTILSFL